MSEGRNKTWPTPIKVLVDNHGCQEEQDMADTRHNLKTQDLDNEILSVCLLGLLFDWSSSGDSTQEKVAYPACPDYLVLTNIQGFIFPINQI